MTVLNFPSTAGKPTDGSFQYIANGVVYSWDGEKWVSNTQANGGGGGRSEPVHFDGPDAPDFDSLIAGDQWYNTNDGRLYTYTLNDNNDLVWVDASPDSQVPQFWERTGTTLEPTNDGDDVSLGTGDLSAAAGTFSGEVNVDDWYGGTTTYGARLGGLGHKFRADSPTTTIADFFGGPGNFSVIGQVLRIKGTHLEIGGKDVGGGTTGWNAKFTRDGYLRIGGTLTDATTNPNIELKPDGSATFTNNVASTRGSGDCFYAGPNTPGAFDAAGFICNLATKDSANARYFKGNYNGVEVFGVRKEGTTVFRNALINLEPDDPANYTATMVDGEEQQVYNGPTLDVKDRVLNLISRLDALEANEVIDDATDTSLLQLLANASARLDSIEARLTALEGGN